MFNDIGNKADTRLVVHLQGSNQPFTVWVDGERQSEVAEWLIGIMKTNGYAVFQDEHSIHATVRGAAIAGFGFDKDDNSAHAAADREVMELSLRRLRAEVKHWEKMAEGDSWKDGY